MSQLDSGFPVRSCIGCRKKSNPTALIRVVLVDGKVIPDVKGGAQVGALGYTRNAQKVR